LDCNPHKYKEIKQKKEGNQVKNLQTVNIQAEVSSFEKAKELLDDLGVLIDKYEIAVTISIFPQEDFEELYRLPE
jgi:hypothetical protein